MTEQEYFNKRIDLVNLVEESGEFHDASFYHLKGMYEAKDTKDYLVHLECLINVLKESAKHYIDKNRCGLAGVILEEAHKYQSEKNILEVIGGDENVRD